MVARSRGLIYFFFASFFSISHSLIVCRFGTHSLDFSWYPSSLSNTHCFHLCSSNLLVSMHAYANYSQAAEHCINVLLFYSVVRVLFYLIFISRLRYFSTLDSLWKCIFNRWIFVPLLFYSSLLSILRMHCIHSQLSLAIFSRRLFCFFLHFFSLCLYRTCCYTADKKVTKRASERITRARVKWTSEVLLYSNYYAYNQTDIHT